MRGTCFHVMNVGVRRPQISLSFAERIETLAFRILLKSAAAYGDGLGRWRHLFMGISSPTETYGAKVNFRFVVAISFVQRMIFLDLFFQGS